MILAHKWIAKTSLPATSFDNNRHNHNTNKSINCPCGHSDIAMNEDNYRWAGGCEAYFINNRIEVNTCCGIH